MDAAEATARVRLDKWLWAARFFKTRSLAADAIEGGKIEVNGDRAKRAKQVGAGDEVRVRIGAYEHVVQVRGVSERRGPATEAALLYEETAASAKARATLALQMRAANAAYGYDEGRPTKKDRREIQRFKDRKF
jgi:ribosome-associated heat shock protein Hsp15